MFFLKPSQPCCMISCMCAADNITLKEYTDAYDCASEDATRLAKVVHDLTESECADTPAGSQSIQGSSRRGSKRKACDINPSAIQEAGAKDVESNIILSQGQQDGNGESSQHASSHGEQAAQDVPDTTSL